MGSFGVSVKRALSVCASSAMLLSGMASGFNAKMIDECVSVCTDFVPSGMDSALSRYFASFELGRGVKVIGNISPSILEAKAKKNKFECAQVDINSTSFDSVSAIVESNKGKKLVLCLTNLDCISEGKFRDILKLLDGNDDVFLYVYRASGCCCCSSCGDAKCKDCINLRYDLQKFGLVETLTYPGGFGLMLLKDAKEFAKNAVKAWIVLKNEGKIDICIDLDEEDIGLISLLFMDNDDNWISNLVEHSFTRAYLRDPNNLRLCLADFLVTFGEILLGSAVDIGMSCENEMSTLVHEMGHAFAAFFYGAPPCVVVSSGNSNGFTAYIVEKMMKGQCGYDEIVAVAKIGLAGKVAAKIILGEDQYGAWNDLIKVKSLINEAVRIKDPMLGNNPASLISAVEALYNEICTEVENIVRGNAELIKRLAERLMSKERVNGLRIMKGSEFIKSVAEIKANLEEEATLGARLREFMKSNKLTEDFVKYVEEYGRNNEKDNGKDKGKEENGGNLSSAPASTPVVNVVNKDRDSNKTVDVNKDEVDKDENKKIDVKKVVVKTYSNEQTKKDESSGKKEVTSVAKLR